MSGLLKGDLKPVQTPVNSVLTAAFMEPGMARQTMDAPAVSRLDFIVNMALPGALPATLERTRVSLVTDKGVSVVPRENWHRITPKAGVKIVIRVVPGKNALRTLLQIVVTVVAYALGSFIGGFLGSLVSAGLAAAGNLLINALIPPASDKKPVTKPTFQISGFKNRFEPNGAVPMVLGTMRMAPAYAATPWTEIVGDFQYIRALFVFGEGNYDISDLKIGDTPVAKYSNVSHELRSGLPGDPKVTLFPRQVIEETFNVEIAKTYPRDEFGEIIPGPLIDAPVSRFTATDASGFGVVLYFPVGLGVYDKKGRLHSSAFTLTMRYRLEGAGAWTTIPTVTFRAAKPEAFYRQLFYNFPARGRYEVEFNTTTAEVTNSQALGRMTLAALQSIRPEYPLNHDKPLAVLAMRVKATFQLNGALDNVNAVVKTVCPDYDAASGTWITRATNNPASLFRHVLQTAAYPVPDGELDLAFLARWHTFCVERGLHYNAVHEETASLQDVLSAVCLSGRATPRHDGLKWSVVVDGLNDLVDHLSSRNARNFAWSRSYQRAPDAWRIEFTDETNDYTPAERLVVRPGLLGPVVVTEKLELPGKTHPDEIYREGLRRFKELEHRPDRFTVTQDGANRVAVRGDRVSASFDTLDERLTHARVKAVNPGKIGGAHEVVLDEWWTADAAISYGMRFLKFAADADGFVTATQSVLSAINTLPGESNVVILPAMAELPAVDDIVHIGPLTSKPLELVVHSVEPGDDFASVLTLVNHARQIDIDVDSTPIPAWSPRIGADAGASAIVPPAPQFTAIRTGITGTGIANGLQVQLAAGAGATVIIVTFVLEHRLGASGPWTIETFPAASAGFLITSYAGGDSVQLRVKAVSIDGEESPYSSVQTVVIGSGDAAEPNTLASVTVTGALGFAYVDVSTSMNVDELRIYAKPGTGGVLDTGTNLAATYEVAAGQMYQFAIGDGTRTNAVLNGGMVIDASWTKGTGWTIATGIATKAAGTASGLSQALDLVAGKSYRIAFTISGRTAGGLKPGFTGGTAVDGVTRSGNGRFYDLIVAGAGNTQFALLADSAFDGSIDDVVVFEETALCLAQGDHTFWVHPVNDDVEGPLSGPFVALIT